jgi:hypothetical protein
MFTLGDLHIGDDLQINIGDRGVKLRPAQGLRAVEALLRASTRAMMTEEAERASNKRSVGSDRFLGMGRTGKARAF